MPSEDQKDHMSNQQHQQQQQDTKIAANSNPNVKSNSTISNEIANVTNAFKEKKKLVRRAFSMPRNLFRLSRRIKISNSSTTTKISTSIDENSSTTTTTTTAAVVAAISCNQLVQTNCDEQNKLNMENVENNKHRTLPVSSSSSSEMSHSDVKQQQQQQPPPPPQQQHLPEAKPEQDNKHRLFRRSTWKKFLFSRFILQSINLKVNLSINISYSFRHVRGKFYASKCIY